METVHVIAVKTTEVDSDCGATLSHSGGSSAGVNGVLPSKGGIRSLLHATKGGHKYYYLARLSAAQIAVLDQIVDYGYSQGYSTAVVTIAVNEAFYESSLGSLESNPTNQKVAGLYQYNSSTWHDFGHDNLNRQSDTDQIVAMYQDIAHFSSRYTQKQATGEIPGSITFPEYIEIKHELGPNYDKFNTTTVVEAIKKYEAKVADLRFVLS